MARKQFILPDLGEGLREARIKADEEIYENGEKRIKKAWLVSVGDVVAVDQPIVEVETEKAAVEVPSPYAGKITSLYKDGTGDVIIAVGDVLCEIETDIAAAPKVSAPPAEVDPKDTIVMDKSEKVDETFPLSPVSDKEEERLHCVPTNRVEKSPRALPIVRALAKERDIDLSHIKGTGPDGHITRADVRAASQGGVVSEKKIDSEGVQWMPLSATQNAMAQNMARAHKDVVPVFRLGKARLLNWKSASRVMPRLVRAIVAACRAVPEFNMWYDGKRGMCRVHEHVDLGIAVDTDKGNLLVPVLQHADTLDSEDLEKALRVLTKSAREGSLSLGAKPTITLSNVGTLGEDDGGSAIIVPPQVAIVVASRIREEACVLDHSVAVCKVLPLSLVFDHRVLTGAAAMRFLRAMVDALESFDDYMDE